MRFLPALAALLILGAMSCGDDDDTGPTNTPDSTRDTTDAATPSATPGVSETPEASEFPELTPFSTEILEKLHEIRDTVSEIRGIEIHPTAEEGLISTEGLAAYGQDQFSDLEDDEAADIASSEAMLALMGLAPPGYTFEDYAGEEANITAGVYYFEPNKLVLVGDNPDDLRISEELTIAHEYTHSLQDARFELGTYFDTWTESQEEEDGYTSYSETLRCLIEGDAELTQRLYAEQVYGEDWQDLVDEESADDEPIDFDIPDFLLNSFGFYYNDCVIFVEALYEEGGWDAVNDAYENPPGTTEQIIDIDKFHDDEWADDPKPADPGADLSGWTEVFGGQFGQFDVYNYLGVVTGDYSSAPLTSFGWSSGWIRLFRNDAEPERIAVEVRLAWDSPSSAFLFETAFEDALDNLDVTESETSADGTERWVVNDESNQHGALQSDDDTIRLVFANDDPGVETILELE